MLHPTIKELSKEEFNRYELTLATAKCARALTDEYSRQREEAEKAMTGNKESDRNLMNSIDQDLKDEKAIKNAIDRLYDGRFEIYRGEKEEIIFASALKAKEAEQTEDTDAAEDCDGLENAESPEAEAETEEFEEFELPEQTEE